MCWGPCSTANACPVVSLGKCCPQTRHTLPVEDGKMPRGSKRYRFLGAVRGAELDATGSTHNPSSQGSALGFVKKGKRLSSGLGFGPPDLFPLL